MVRTRLKDNLEIIRQLKHYVTQNPDQRFGQILRNIGVIVNFQATDGQVQWANHFNEEPEKMLERMKQIKKGTKT